MGCSNSKTPTGEALEDTAEHAKRRRSVKQKNPAALEEKIEYPPSESFIIPLDGIEDVKEPPPLAVAQQLATPYRKPPKRIQELMEKANSTDLSLKMEDLEEKQRQAELRRQEYLQQRVANMPKMPGLLEGGRERQLELEMNLDRTYRQRTVEETSTEERERKFVDLGASSI